MLQVYYDRDVYTVDFDLNGGYGTNPDTQKVRYGGLVKGVEEPVKAGYSFKGWHLEDNGLDGGLWDFTSPVEANTASLETTLYAKWADELAPQMGEAAFGTERKDFLNWLIKKRKPCNHRASPGRGKRDESGRIHACPGTRGGKERGGSGYRAAWAVQPIHGVWQRRIGAACPAG